VNPEVLIIGCGFLGEAAAELFSARGKKVVGVVRSKASLKALEGRPFETVACDVTDLESLSALRSRFEGVPLALYSVSAGGGNAERYSEVYREGIRRVLEKWNPKRIIFVSSTSVYAQTDGSWVTEESPTIPSAETALILLEAEAIALAAGGTVARLSGIYGPGRSMLLKKFIAGEAVLEEGGARWLNQIHRDDAAEALYRLSSPSAQASIINVSDDKPATQRELYGWIAAFLNRSLPPEGPTDWNRKRGWTSKRVSNKKLRSLGWIPNFPSYRDALTRLFPENNPPI
jgi:nucleoside-diphosphate-sugar epimerase